MAVARIYDDDGPFANGLRSSIGLVEEIAFLNKKVLREVRRRKFVFVDQVKIRQAHRPATGVFNPVVRDSRFLEKHPHGRKGSLWFQVFELRDSG